ncbi:MAG: hypothetical protein PHP42_02110 [Bacteroidota bacterium]|nr:hypothetical protein [Bacteroidota bacterium]
MVRFIAWLIIGFILAKILGAVLRALRNLFQPAPPQHPVQPRQGKQPYTNVQDIDYEDVSDKK